VYRKGRYDAYKVEDWNVVRNLPPGYAALFSSFCGGVLVVMSMDQVVRRPLSSSSPTSLIVPRRQWYRGPIAIAIAGPDAEFGGDVGFELGMLVAGLVYLPTRYLEKRIFGR
jgi:purine-cytosine permease-like protein